MNNNFKNFAIFVAGAALGGCTSYFYLKKIHEDKYDEDIQSVKEAFNKKYNKEYNEVENASATVNVDSSNEDLKKNLDISKFLYEDIVNNSGYVDYANVVDVDEDTIPTKPFVVKPEDFGDIVEYEIVTLKYFSDGALIDEDNEVVEDVEFIVGLDALRMLDKYDTDSVYVRNDVKETYYEVIYDERRYDDLVLDGRLR